MNIMVPGIHAPVNNVAATPEKAVSESITAEKNFGEKRNHGETGL